MRKIKEVIVVEGRYDQNTLAQVVDATVVTLGGFAVFNDKEKVAFLRRLAAERGLIVLTDSDGAGFVIRNYLKGALPKEQVKQAYIPDIHGKEKRKRAPGKEGKLGVEGMKPEVILEALRREVLRSVPYVLFEERPSKVDDDDPTGYGEQYRSFDGGRHPSELPKGAADHTQDRKGEEDL